MTKTATEFPVGSWERPDAGGIVRRGEGVSEHFKGYVEHFGEAPHCFAGHEFGCEKPAVMDVYGLHFCEAHGEEAASGALEEIVCDLEMRLDRHADPNLDHALRLAIDATPNGHPDAALLNAFPLNEQARDQVEPETFMYIEETKAGKRRFGISPPYDTHLTDRSLVCRHMRLAFEDGATWLVEFLEKHREESAAQAAWTVALYNEAGI